MNGNEKVVNLTAESYDIEIDLLDEVLSKKLNYSFVNIALPPVPAKTSFTFLDNIKKMNFLIKKNCHLKDSLHEYFMEFEKSEDFISSQEDLESMDVWIPYKEEIMKICKK